MFINKILTILNIHNLDINQIYLGINKNEFKYFPRNTKTIKHTDLGLRGSVVHSQLSSIKSLGFYSEE